MAGTKLVVIYPRPTDLEAFEKAYVGDHVPMAKEKIKGMTKFVATKVLGTPDGQTPPCYRIAELHYRGAESIGGIGRSAGGGGTRDFDIQRGNADLLDR